MPPPPHILRHVLGASYRGGGLVFTPCGTSLLLALSARVQHIHLPSGRAHTLPHEARHDLLTLSLPSANLLLTLDTRSRLTLLALPSARVAARLSLRLDAAVAAVASPCGRFVAFANATATEVWKLPAEPIPAYAAFDRIARFGKGCARPGGLAWSADSRHVAVGASGGVVTVFTLPREGEVGQGIRVKPLTLYGHRDVVVFVRFCGNRGLVTLSADGVLYCWRLREYGVGKRGEEGGQGRVTVPLGAKLVSRHFVRQGGAKRVRSASVHEGLLVVGLSNGVFALYQLPDEMVQESEEMDDGLFAIGEMRRRKRKREREGRGMKGDGNREKKRGKLGDGEEAGNGDVEEETSESDEEEALLDDKVPVISFTELTLLHTLSASGGAITDIAFNATGEWIALASSESGQVVVWEWRSETHILKQQAHTQTATAVAFSPDGRAVATGSEDGRVKVWGVETGFCVATFTEHDAGVTGVAFAARDVVVSSSRDGTVRAFDLRRYRNFRVLVGPPPRRQFGAVAVDGPGELIAASCVDTFEVIVWSLRTGNVLEVLHGHKAPVCALAFRPRRGTLATASWDRNVRLWDMYERKGACEALEHSKEVLAVAFRPDGREFAACTAAGEIVLWDAERGVVAGSIDGARDAAGGRLRDARTMAPQKGHFQTLCYSADGRFLLAGAVAKHVCVYHVPEGSRPSLVAKVAVTDNQAFDGLLDKLNSKNLSVSGHALDAIADDDPEAVHYGEARVADRTSLPGAPSQRLLRRRKLLKAEVKCVHACPTGRLWGAVTHEGVLVYGDEAADDADAVFDPTHLALDVTPGAALRAARKREYTAALHTALRLNERDCLNQVVEAVPVEAVGGVVGDVPRAYFGRLVGLLAWRLEHTPHLEFNLRWAKRVLLGGRGRGGSEDIGGVHAALRALNRACVAHARRLVPVGDRNESVLRYLIARSKRREEVKTVT